MKLVLATVVTITILVLDFLAHQQGLPLAEDLDRVTLAALVFTALMFWMGDDD